MGCRRAKARLWVSLALIASACGTDIQSGIESANDLLYRQDYVEAERLFRKLLKRLETSGELSEAAQEQRLLILDRLGKTNALYLHDYSQAIADYGSLVRSYPKTDQALAARAGVADIYQHKLGNLEAAIDEYQTLVTEFPQRMETRWAQLQIIQGYLQLKNYDQARTEAEALINRWPESKEAAQARFEIANSYYVQERYAEAIATYERLLEDPPDPSVSALVLFELGNCFQELGESERALAYFYACLPEHPNPLLVQRKIKRVRRRLNRTKPLAGIYKEGHGRHGVTIPATSPAAATTASGSAPNITPTPTRPSVPPAPVANKKPAAASAGAASEPAPKAATPVAPRAAQSSPGPPSSVPSSTPKAAAPAPGAPKPKAESKPAPKAPPATGTP